MNSSLSLDEIEKAKWKRSPAPFETPFTELKLSRSALPLKGEKLFIQPLNGKWQMAEGGYTNDRTDITKVWKDAIPANIPCSVHTALFEAGRIPDPMVGKNDKIARENSYKTWWFKCEFERNDSLIDPSLRFDGVCYPALQGRTPLYRHD